MTALIVPPGYRVPRGTTLPEGAQARFEEVYLTDLTRDQEYDAILPLLPLRAQDYARPFLKEIDEIKLDHGKPIQFRQRGVYIAHPLIGNLEDIERIEGEVKGFKTNGRKGVKGSSHRISAGKNDTGRYDKVTIRVGRLMRGPAEPFRDVILNAKGLGICGKPGSGKTTFLRDGILIKGEVFGFAVNVVDTSNEMLGEGDEPHPQFCHVRQDKVGAPENLVPVLKEAIRNHGTDYIYADEVGYSNGDVELVLQADRFGPSITSSVHGEQLRDVLLNPILQPMFGVQGRTDGTRIITGHPAFEAFIEVRTRSHFVLHRNLADSVQRLLRGEAPITEHVFTRTIRQ